LDTSSANPFTSSDTLVTVSNLPSVFTGGGFDLYVYYDGLINVGAANRVGQYEVFNGPNTAGALLGTVYGKDTASFAGTFIRASGTTAANATSGNYVEFTGLHASTFTLQAFGVAGDVPRAPINAIQIVAETPEPSSLILLAIGGLALGGAALRRMNGTLTREAAARTCLALEPRLGFTHDRRATPSDACGPAIQAS
jgi:hypothetical protein